MKKKEILNVMALSALTFTLFSGCGSDSAEEDLTSYITEQMPDITDMENTVTSGSNSVLGKKYVDDQTLLLKLKDDVIPNSDELIEKAKAVTTQTEKLSAIHKKYIEAMITQNKGFTMLLKALEQDSNIEMAEDANKLLKEADAQTQNYETELEAFAEDNGLVIEQ